MIDENGKSKFIELTLYGSNERAYIVASSITAITPLEAYHDDLLGFEGSERTRVDYGKFGSVLVKETARLIMEKIRNAGG
jgi:hypothetical protein